MSCKIILTTEFKRQAKRLAKKHRSLQNDLRLLFDSLLLNPYQGDKIGEDIYKVRMAIKSQGKGKSGVAGIITYLDFAIKNDAEKIDVHVLYSCRA
jgi:mRNA-degrading endonuclease RelE of RelBE toxin-antitoxin system